MHSDSIVNGNEDMTYSLDNFCNDTRTILSESNDSDGREKIRLKLEQLLTDQAFCGTYTSAENNSGMSQIFEDPELHFCVLAYNMEKPRTSPPHDHGRSWAIYGQVAGYTDMTIWESAEDDNDNISQARSFRLDPGQAGLFDTREVHSIDYPAGSKFIRITGVDMSKEARRVFDPVSGAVKVVESVGTGTRA